MRWETKRAELAFVASAVRNGGKAPGPAVGTRGVGAAMFNAEEHEVSILAFARAMGVERSEGG